MVKFSNIDILPHQLTDIQEQVFIGGLLGDASLEFAKTSKFPRMKIDRQVLDRGYLEWQFDIFKDLCTETAFKEIERYDVRYNKINKQVSFRTRAVPAFKHYYEKWYLNRIKIIPSDLKLTPLICAVWFADDGCIIKTGKRSLTLKIATDGFGYKGAKFLADQLENIFDCEFPIYKKSKNGKLWFIKTSTKAAIAFIKYIEPELQYMNMSRKIDIWKSSNIDDWDLDNFASYVKIAHLQECKNTISKIVNSALSDLDIGTKIKIRDLINKVEKETNINIRTINGLVPKCVKEHQSILVKKGCKGGCYKI